MFVPILVMAPHEDAPSHSSQLTIKGAYSSESHSHERHRLTGIHFALRSNFHHYSLFSYSPVNPSWIPTHSKTTMSESKTSDEAKEGSNVVVVTRLEPNDVLFGRGAPAVGHRGNIRFREIVSSRRVEYERTSKRKEKNLIAQQIAGAVRNRQGRFLRKIESRAEAERHGVPRGTSAWMVVASIFMWRVPHGYSEVCRSRAAQLGM